MERTRCFALYVRDTTCYWLILNQASSYQEAEGSSGTPSLQCLWGTKP